MSYCAYDNSGFLGDVASISGWRDFTNATRTKPALQFFITKGYTDDPQALSKALAFEISNESADSVRANLAAIAAKADGTLLITDGEANEDDSKAAVVKYSDDQPRADDGKWTDAGGGLIWGAGQIELVSTKDKRVRIDTTKYSDEEPRDDHGRWTDGGGAAQDASSGGTPANSPNKYAALPNKGHQEERTARVTEIVKATLAEIGMEDQPIKVSSDAKSPPSRLGGPWGIFGQYDPVDRTITLWSNANGLNYANEVRDVVLHEASHARFDDARLNSRVVDNFIKDNPKNLEQEDGTTKYSKSYWSRFNDNPSGNAFLRAVDESLAEMNMRGRFPKTYKTLNQLVKENHRGPRRG